METPIRIGTRGSSLALVQARQVEAALARFGAATTIVVIRTAGDRRAPDAEWGEGAFVTAIEEALRDDIVDVAVHSAKDLPIDRDPGLIVAAYLVRAGAGDALVARGLAGVTLDTLPAGARIGTDSPRRAGFIRARRPDLRVHPLHGNVDTRLRRLDDGETDALVLAVAGLERLGRDDRISERLDVRIIPPAPGQGAIAVQVRADDHRSAALVAAIDDRPTRVAVEAERTFLRRSGGGCRSPIGALASLEGDELRIVGGYALPDGSAAAISDVAGPLAACDVLVDRLVDRLAATAPGAAMPRLTMRDPRPRVLVTRALAQAATLAEALRARGVAPVVVPAIELEPRWDADVDRMAGSIRGAAWIVVTSANGAAAALALLERMDSDPAGFRWAAVGPATARTVLGAGVPDAWTPSQASARALAVELPVEAGEAVVIVRASIGDPSLAAVLRARGAVVTDVAAYATIEGPDDSRPLLRAALDRGTPAAVLFGSASAVRGLLRLAAPDVTASVLAIPAICIGPGTSRAAAAHGFRVLGESGVQQVDALAARAAGLVRAGIGGVPA